MKREKEKKRKRNKRKTEKKKSEKRKKKKRGERGVCAIYPQIYEIAQKFLKLIIDSVSNNIQSR